MNFLAETLAISVACILFAGCAPDNDPSLDESQFAACLANDVLDLVRDGASEEEKAKALQHVFAWYGLSLQQNPSHSDDTLKILEKYTYGPGGSFELNRYMSDQAATLLKEEGLLDLVNVHMQSPGHPKAEAPIGTIDFKKQVEAHLRNMTNAEPVHRD